ncbi:MAG TPA: sigma-70 family RNA polymerase sigma factor [Dehalococcoidia bacterium]
MVRAERDIPREAPGRLAEESEERLVEAARELGDEAWAEIYRRHAQQVYAYIYYRIGDQHVAEDLAADVFVKAIAGIKGYVWRGTPLLAWLYRIAHNVTVDHRKAAGRRLQIVGSGEPENVVERRDVIRELDETTDMMSAIQRLTDDQQQVILLRFYHGLSNADVARIVAKPEGAVKALQARGLRALRRIIDGEEGPRTRPQTA